MKLLIVGVNGMLGQALACEGNARGLDVTGLDLREADIELNITDDSRIREVITTVAPDVIVNCAAIVDVALCDADQLLAWQVNARCVGVMAEACRDIGGKFVQVSTDHYFTGGENRSHDEKAHVVFFNEYARTKYAGEGFATVCSDHLVLRTNIIGFRGHGKPTFAEWAFDAVSQDAEMTLFDDSYVSCIDVGAFSRALLDLASTGACGLYNLANSEVFSKKQLIEAFADAVGVNLTRTTSGSVNTLDVPRAESCGLDVRRAESVLGYTLPGLRAVAENLATQWRNR